MKMNKQQIEKEFPTMVWHFERSHGFEEMLESITNSKMLKRIMENYENYRKQYYMLMNEWERS